MRVHAHLSPFSRSNIYADPPIHPLPCAAADPRCSNQRSRRTHSLHTLHLLGIEKTSQMRLTLLRAALSFGSDPGTSRKPSRRLPSRDMPAILARSQNRYVSLFGLRNR